MQWSLWFAGMMGAEPADRMYNCLPMYHSVGGVSGRRVRRSAAGGAVVIREKFSASQFWNDIVRWDCTMFQYIGELCRYLLHTAPSRRMKPRIGSGWPAATDWRLRFGTASRTDFASPKFWNFMRPRKVRLSVQCPRQARRDRPYPGLSGASILAGLGALRCRERRTGPQRAGILHSLRAE